MLLTGHARPARRNPWWGAIALTLLFIAVWALIVHPPARAASTVRYVATTGADAGDCSNSASPCATVQYAVDQSSDVDADEIRVAAGTYTGVTLRTGQQMDGEQMVYISKTVTIRGGYTTGNWNTSNPTVNVTTLDAEGDGRVFLIEGFGDITVTLDGLRIINGNATGQGLAPQEEQDAGGGINVQFANLVIQNSVIMSNTASAAAPGWGGGLYAAISNVTILTSTVQANVASASNDADHAGNGGGLFIDTDVSGASILRNNQILNNTGSLVAGGAGGGAYLTIGNFTVEDNLFQGNVSTLSEIIRFGDGGGLHTDNAVTLLLQRNTFQNNTASELGVGRGGGLTVIVSSDFIIRHNTFTGNIASNGPSNLADGKGGAIYVDSSTGTIEQNVVQGNVAVNQGTFASEPLLPDLPAIGRGGGIYAVTGSVQVVDNLIVENVASQRSAVTTVNQGEGGGLYLTGNDLELTLTRNRLFRNQAAPNSRGQGGAFFINSGAYSITNNFIAENLAGSLGSSGDGAFITGAGDAVGTVTLIHNTFASNFKHAVVGGPFSNITMAYTILYNHTAPIKTTASTASIALRHTLWEPVIYYEQAAGSAITTLNNRDGAPDFNGPALDDYHLRSGSAAINMDAEFGLAIDIDGHTRPAGSYDAGADEYGSTGFGDVGGGNTPTPTPTWTPGGPTATFTPSGAETATPTSQPRTATPTPTITPTSPPGTPTPTRTPTPTPTPGPTNPPGQVPLAQGWNLVSSSLRPTPSAPAAALNSISGSYDEVWTYLAADLGDPWKTFVPPSTGDLAAINEYTGFWIHATIATILNVAGPNPPAPVELLLKPGWNLTGFPVPQALNVTTAMNTGTCTGKWNLVYEFDPTDDDIPWRKYNAALPPQLNTLGQMQPGKGYWIRATGNCYWRPLEGLN